MPAEVSGGEEGGRAVPGAEIRAESCAHPQPPATGKRQGVSAHTVRVRRDFDQQARRALAQREGLILEEASPVLARRIDRCPSRIQWPSAAPAEARHNTL